MERDLGRLAALQDKLDPPAAKNAVHCADRMRSVATGKDGGAFVAGAGAAAGDVATPAAAAAAADFDG